WLRRAVAGGDELAIADADEIDACGTCRRRGKADADISNGERFNVDVVDADGVGRQPAAFDVEAFESQFGGDGEVVHDAPGRGERAERCVGGDLVDVSGRDRVKERIGGDRTDEGRIEIAREVAFDVDFLERRAGDHGASEVRIYCERRNPRQIRIRAS